jgi:hypothetical protein
MEIRIDRVRKIADFGFKNEVVEFCLAAGRFYKLYTSLEAGNERLRRATVTAEVKVTRLLTKINTISRVKTGLSVIKGLDEGSRSDCIKAILGLVESGIEITKSREYERFQQTA